jgi:uroporphyrin-III C-methyltransferase
MASSFPVSGFSHAGEVALAGAGPGDPGLLTLKAFQLIREADIVLYDALVSEAIMELVPQSTECRYVGKRSRRHAVPQGALNDILVAEACAGKKVLRLKGGDPFIFGRGGEELEALAAAGLSFQVVPGITAASGCASYAGIPLTHRDHAQSVRFITGHLQSGDQDLAWRALAMPGQTLVFYMGIANAGWICRQLMAHGVSPDMGAAVIERGTQPGQRVIRTCLADLSARVLSENIVPPALIVVGSVVALHDRLAWFDQAT